jgi:hypothetical protein
MMGQPFTVPWKSIGAFCVVWVLYVAIAVLMTKTEHENANCPIAGVLYSWPEGTTISPPQPPGHYGKGYVRYRSSNKYPDPAAFLLIFDGDKQRPVNQAGIPDLQMITSRWSKQGELSVTQTGVGTVICNRKSVAAGVAFSCGLSFSHRNARWQLQFDAEQIPNTVKLHQEAVRRLEAFRTPSPF